MKIAAPAAAEIVAVALLAAAACGGDERSAPPSTTGGEPTTPPAETAGPEEALGGREIYLQAGCAGCHGENAEGTDIGPALTGHSHEQVLRQVRTPLGGMPAYSDSMLSDEHLDEIADYVESLGPMGMHVEPEKLSNLVTMHHWLALSAAQSGDLDDALHHVDHIIGSVKGRHRAQMKEVRELLLAGDAHDAEHPIEEMLAGTAEPSLRRGELHLRLALAFLQRGDRQEALHHMRHFAAVARVDEKRTGREVIADLEAGDLHDATHGLQALLGRPHE